MPDRSRFQKIYGIPAGRPEIARKSLEPLYRIEKVLDGGSNDPKGAGALNNGVYLVRNRQSGKLRVQKCIPTDSSKVDPVMLQREILLLQVLRHPHVVGYVDACITDGVPRQMSLYMEYCDLGSLQKLINQYIQKKDRLAELESSCQQSSPSHVSAPESFVWHVLHSLTSALQYLHSGIEGNDYRDPPEPKDPSEWPPIMHRDIKPDNILLRCMPGALSSNQPPSGPLIYPHWPFNKNKDPKSWEKTYPKIVLADFGVATQYHEPDFSSPFLATLTFSPPELPRCSGRGDMWSLGASVLSLCRLLPNGPVSPPPPHYPDSRGWYMNPECRRRVAHIGPGAGYSSDLDRVLRASLRFSTADRASGWRLMKKVRLAEARLFLPEGKGLVVRPLPAWVYGS